MKNEYLLLIKKHTDMLIEQTISRLQETLELKLNKKMKTFSRNPPLNLFEGRKCLLAATSFETTNSVFYITNENNCFPFGTTGYWGIPNFLLDGNIDELKEILEPRSQIDIELHVEEDEKRGTRIEIENSGCNFAGFDQFKIEILSEL